MYFVERSLWICGRVLRTSQSPSGRVDKLKDNPEGCPRAYPHSLASRPQAPQAQRQGVLIKNLIRAARSLREHRSNFNQEEYILNS